MTDSTQNEHKVVAVAVGPQSPARTVLLYRGTLAECTKFYSDLCQDGPDASIGEMGLVLVDPSGAPVYAAS